MSIRLRSLVIGALAAAAIGGSVSSASAASVSADQQLAKAGVLKLTDFPEGFESKAPSDSSNAAVAKLAKGIRSCAAYVALQKLTDAQPKASSRNFEDDTRQVSNEVDVFKSAAGARSALALYAKTSVPTCLNLLFKKLLTQEFAKDPKTKGKIAGVTVKIEPQAVSGLGDDSVVYEGNAQIALNDGSSQQIGLGNAAVLVGRAVSDYTYITSGADLTEILQPTIDASVARLRTSLTST
jgi:hypothetical protein